jgi:hypothetical protein
MFEVFEVFNVVEVVGVLGGVWGVFGRCLGGGFFLGVFHVFFAICWCFCGFHGF